jgi:hypothetical protein
MTAEEHYKKAFGVGDGGGRDKVKMALDHALDIRKFEIGLYWRRATYVWTLIAATFAGYFAVLSAEHMEDKRFNAYVIASVGFVFSVAWLLTNRGSKYWQENWESHVDMLEDTIAGPLYKTVLQRADLGRGLKGSIIGPAAYSVSQINQWVSAFTIFIWTVLIWNVLPDMDLSASVSGKHVAVGLATVAATFALWCGAKSEIVVSRKSYVMKQRTAGIDG